MSAGVFFHPCDIDITKMQEPKANVAYRKYRKYASLNNDEEGIATRLAARYADIRRWAVIASDLTALHVCVATKATNVTTARVLQAIDRKSEEIPPCQQTEPRPNHSRLTHLLMCPDLTTVAILITLRTRAI